MMYSQGYGTFLLEMFVVCVAGTPENFGSNVMKPVGPKICYLLCDHRVGCSSYVFKISDLSCKLNVVDTTRHTPTGGIFASKDKERKYMDSDMKCQKGAKIFHTRRHGIQCRLRWPKKRKRGPNTRLLMLSFTAAGRYHQGRQLSLRDNSVALYSYVSTPKTRAVAYIAKSEKLVISSESPSELFLTPLDKSKKTVIRKNEIFRGIAVDEGKRLVFLSSLMPTQNISVMTTEGENFNTVVTLKDFLGGIAVDPKRSMIYVVCLFVGIYKYSYQGVFQSEVVGSKGVSVFVNTKADFVYYMSRNPFTVSKVALSDNSSMSMTQVPVTEFICCENLHVIGTTYYVTPIKPGDKIMAFTEKGNKTIISTGFEKSYVEICGIP